MRLKYLWKYFLFDVFIIKYRTIYIIWESKIKLFRSWIFNFSMIHAFVRCAKVFTHPNTLPSRHENVPGMFYRRYYFTLLGNDVATCGPHICAIVFNSHCVIKNIFIHNAKKHCRIHRHINENNFLTSTELVLTIYWHVTFLHEKLSILRLCSRYMMRR